MKMIKASHWTVRGELEFNKLISLQGRQYRLVRCTRCGSGSCAVQLALPDWQRQSA